eukprot:1136283-Pelagomonas_calceolata.AAC.2
MRVKDVPAARLYNASGVAKIKSFATLYLCVHACVRACALVPEHLTVTFYLEAPKACVSDTSTPRLPSLYATFIDFKQAYESIPRDRCKNNYTITICPANSSPFLDLYQDDKYILIDRDKRSSVQPTHGVEQGCPQSPLQFSIYVNDIGCITEGETGAVTSLPDLHVSNMLYAGDLALTANNHTHMQAMLIKLQGYATRECLTVNAHKFEVVCFYSRAESLPPLLYDGDSLPYTDSFRYL